MSEQVKLWYSMPLFTTDTFRIETKDGELETYLKVTRVPGAFIVKNIDGGDCVSIVAKYDNVDKVKTESVKNTIGAI